MLALRVGIQILKSKYAIIVASFGARTAPHSNIFCSVIIKLTVVTGVSYEIYAQIIFRKAQYELYWSHNIVQREKDLAIYETKPSSAKLEFNAVFSQQ